jgi:hypothetical protein
MKIWTSKLKKLEVPSSKRQHAIFFKNSQINKLHEFKLMLNGFLKQPRFFVSYQTSYI